MSLATDGRRVDPALDDALRAVLTRLIPGDARISGMPDAMGLRGETVLLREAKLSQGRDKLSERQHGFARRARAALGSELELAVVEWGG